jgi:predicted restriction endonuclease
MALVLLHYSDSTIRRWITDYQNDLGLRIDLSTRLEQENDAAELEIRRTTQLEEPERKVLIAARRGQGVFRSNVESIESACKATGVRERSLLHAAHIKPWRVSTNAEKLDGHNGMLLSPHAHLLFDRGLITFNESGLVNPSPLLPVAIQRAWALPNRDIKTRLTDGQQEYLEFHRENVFLSA